MNCYWFAIEALEVVVGRFERGSWLAASEGVMAGQHQVVHEGLRLGTPTSFPRGYDECCLSNQSNSYLSQAY